MEDYNPVIQQVIKDILETLNLSDYIMPFEVECDSVALDDADGISYYLNFIINEEHYCAMTNIRCFEQVEMEYIKEDFEYWTTPSNVFFYKLTPRIVLEMMELERLMKERNNDIM